MDILKKTKFMRLATVLLVIFAIIFQCATARPIEDLAIQTTSNANGKQAYVLSMQRCKGSKVWTLHGLWPAGQECSTEPFSEAKIAPLIDQMKIDWASCPEFGKTNHDFWAHEWVKHGTCHAVKTGTTQIEYFETSLSLLHTYRSSCKDSLVGECRVGLDADLQPV